MKRLIAHALSATLLITLTVAIAACEKSDETKLEEAGQDAGKEADKALDDAGKKADEVLDDGN